VLHYNAIVINLVFVFFVHLHAFIYLLIHLYSFKRVANRLQLRKGCRWNWWTHRGTCNI